MLQEEKSLLEDFEKLKDFRIAQAGPIVDVPTSLLMSIANNVSEVRRKMCFIKAQTELTKYCNSLKKVEDRAKEIVSEFNGTLENLNLEMTMVEEVPSIISSTIGNYLDEKSTEIVLFRLKDIYESEKSMR